MVIEIICFVLSVAYLALAGSVLFSRRSLEEISCMKKSKGYNKISLFICMCMTLAYLAVLVIWTPRIIVYCISGILMVSGFIDIYSAYIRSVVPWKDIKHTKFLRIAYRANSILYAVVSAMVIVLITYNWINKIW